MRVLSLPCAIKNCTRFARVQLKDDALKPDQFVVCQPCASAVVITMLAEISASSTLPEDAAIEFARMVNAWFRRRKGVVLPMRPVGTATYRPDMNFGALDFTH